VDYSRNTRLTTCYAPRHDSAAVRGGIIDDQDIDIDCGL
jgi:hypothetical protein